VADASYPPELRYHPEHDWARLEGDVATFGITWHAQDALGDIVYFDPPALGAQLSQNEPTRRSSRSRPCRTSMRPLSGEVIEVNAQLADKPELVNEDPYGAGWMVKVRVADAAEAGGLLDRDAYVAALEE